MIPALTPCTRCKFAVWDRTKAGHPHPSGHGQCTWEATFRVAGSAADFRHHRTVPGKTDR
jgi:hypothetical protein